MIITADGAGKICVGVLLLFDVFARCLLWISRTMMDNLLDNGGDDGGCCGDVFAITVDCCCCSIL